jgi:hypothetical protein
MNGFPWDVATLLGIGLAGVAYICIAIVVYAGDEENFKDPRD